MIKTLFGAVVGTVAGLFLLAQNAVAADQPLAGAGSSAAAPIFRVWARDYSKAHGVALTYEASGSAAGLQKIRTREVAFGASDIAPSSAELGKDGLALFPVAITGVAPVVNLPKVGDAQLRLSGEVLARIFLGDITSWNSPDIAKLNPGLALPDLPIKVVVRSDGSGTTYNFADYLAKVSPAWKDKNGVRASYPWPAGFDAVKGSDGVVKAVKEIPGAIGYLDYGYIKEQRLSAVQLKNLDGEFVKPSNAAFRSAMTGSEWATKGAFSTSLANRPGKGTWPIIGGIYVLLPQVTTTPDMTERAIKFFVWAFVNGDTLVQESSFVRLPDSVQGAAFKVLSTIRDKAGNLVGMAAIGDASAGR
ncbi:MAG TPA: phosphate ABC transporter substrate-binding protein PstS [Azospira sp.]|nr:phosphate ABC transporter substrate-binding protein PstS [Azospira sp.]